MSEQPKNVGSVYVNLKKGAPQADYNALNDALNCLQDIGAYFSISMRNNDSGEYAKFTGFMNAYKRGEKDPDIVIRSSQVATRTASQTPTRYQRGGAQPQARSRTSPQRGAASSAIGPDHRQEAQEGIFQGEELPF